MLTPQVGSFKSVSVPALMPGHESLEGMEPFGWLHTQPQKLPSLSASDILCHAEYLETRRSWDPQSAIVLTCAFTPGSCSLGAHRLSPEGLAWGTEQMNRAKLKEGGALSPPEGSVLQATLLLSTTFQGFWLVPEHGSWNYNFKGAQFNADLSFDLVMGTPLRFYDEAHRPQHFLSFAGETDTRDSVCQRERERERERENFGRGKKKENKSFFLKFYNWGRRSCSSMLNVVSCPRTSASRFF